MEKDFLGDRERSLEEQFFKDQERKVLERLRETQARAEAKKALSRETGIADDAVLERLVGLGFTAANLIPLAVVPWLEVAWADGAIDADERAAILGNLDRTEVPEGSAVREMIEQWLEKRPPREVFESWRAYVRALLPTMKAEDRTWMKERLLKRAHGIAGASGGVFGLAFRTSKAESAALKRIEEAFDI
jgi:hypothetical protein